MTNAKKPLVKALSAVLLLPLPGMVAQIQAQEGALEEIVVTARRTEESLQDVPASVTVLTESTLDNSGINSIERIVALTPGVSIVTNTAEVGDTQINIRGINGARDAENNVALVVDGILKTNTAQVAQIQGELTQAEVLKGPQGAYYGRNAAAGAIVLNTRKPGEEFSGDVSLISGEQGLAGGTVMIDGPVSDAAGIALFADYREFDGFYRNTSPVPGAQGATVDATQNITLGGRLVWNPTDSLEVDTKVRYADFEGSALSFNPVFHLPGFAAALGNPQFDEDVNDHAYDFIGNIKPENTQETKEISVKIDWDLDKVNMTAWALYSDVDQAWIADSTAATFYRFELTESCRQTATDLAASGYQLPSPQFLTPDPFVSVYGPFGPTTCDGTQYQARSQEDVSAEIRFSSLADGPMSWSAGAYFLSLERDTSVSIAQDTGAPPILAAYNPPGSANPTSLMFADAFDTQVFALFGSLDFDLSDTLALSLALRYDREERDVSSRVPNVTDPITGGPINPGLPAVGMIPDASETFDEWQPKVSIAWAASDDWSLFANWGVGFKAGGFNNQGSAAVLEQNFNIPLGSGLNIGDVYDQETSSAFEAGVKGQLFDGRTTVELVGFYTEVTDMQFFEFFTGPFGLLRVVSNIDEVEIYGIEGSVYSSLGSGFDVFGSFSLNDSEIKANSSRPGTEGNESPYTAEYTANIGALWSGQFSGGLSMTARADYRITGPTWFHTVQENQVRTTFDLFFPGLGTADYSQTQRDEFATLDLRLELRSESGWHVAAFGTNVLDEEVIAEVIPSAEFGGSFLAPGALRLMGVEVGYEF
ncbi:MAG: TonB-dependent receptor [Congregibacter sp.]